MHGCQEVPDMNSVVAISPGEVAVADRKHQTWVPRHSALFSRSLFVADTSRELLRTIAGVLDIRVGFPRVSAIVQQVVPHDALAPNLLDRAGRLTLEACSTDDLPTDGWSMSEEEKEFSIVGDLRRMQIPFFGSGPSILDALVAAGYRSVLSVRAVAQSQPIHLTFFSRDADAYAVDDVPAARQVAEYVAVSVSHEQLAAAERNRTEARGRSERSAARVRTLTDNGEAVSSHGRIVGRSPAWQRVRARVLRVAPTNVTVFLQGESGTGKEVVARLVHQASRRKDGPFVAINCAALPEQLLE